jgi:hypothetical protein
MPWCVGYQLHGRLMSTSYMVSLTLLNDVAYGINEIQAHCVHQSLWE